MKLSILTGAGASRAYGLPLIKEVHEFIFNAPHSHFDSDQEFRFSQIEAFQKSGSLNEVEEARATIRAIRVLCDSYSNHQTGYEDWYYTMEQIHRHESRDLDNLLVTPFIEKLSDLLPDRRLADYSTEPPFYSKHHFLAKRTERACQFIRISLAELLKIPLDHFDVNLIPWLSEILNDSAYSIEGIMTLNHDLIIEHFLKEKDVEWSDGFSQTPDEYNLHRWRGFDSRQNTLPVYKLHGSINWNQITFEPENKEIHNQSAKRVIYGKPNGQLNIPRDAQTSRMVLIGRHNKAFDYSAPLFADMHYKAAESLEASNRLIVSGYSFQDKFINRMIISWLSKSSDRKMVIITPSIHDTLTTARYAILGSYYDLEQSSNCGFIESTSENCHFSTIIEKLI